MNQEELKTLVAQMLRGAGSPARASGQRKPIPPHSAGAPTGPATGRPRAAAAGYLRN